MDYVLVTTLRGGGIRAELCPGGMGAGLALKAVDPVNGAYFIRRKSARALIAEVWRAMCRCDARGGADRIAILPPKAGWPELAKLMPPRWAALVLCLEATWKNRDVRFCARGDANYDGTGGSRLSLGGWAGTARFRRGKSRHSEVHFVRRSGCVCPRQRFPALRRRGRAGVWARPVQSPRLCSHPRCSSGCAQDLMGPDRTRRMPSAVCTLAGTCVVWRQCPLERCGADKDGPV